MINSHRSISTIDIPSPELAASAVPTRSGASQVVEHDSSPPDRTNARNIVSRARRDLQNPEPTPATRNTSVRAFADALIKEGDQQLAIGVANSLIRQRLAAETGRSAAGEDKVTVPPDSTFGQAWAELADALESEPFKSFAEAKSIDISKLVINPAGRLSEIKNGRPVDLHVQHDFDWPAASSAVLAAARKVTGTTLGEVRFYDRNNAPADNVAGFYGVQLGPLKSNDTLSTIGQLFRDRSFKALSSADPRDAPIKQRQREAAQRIVDLPPQALNTRIEALTPAPMTQQVQQADQALAQLCAQALMKLLPETGANEFPVMLQNIPEYSTFNQSRKKLLDALTSNAFTTFARENNIEPTSIRINPVNANLTAKVNGVDTVFVLNDLSGWSDVWAHIGPAVRQWASGSEADVEYPTTASASLYDVMHFYNEEVPRQQDTRRPDWRQRQRLAVLKRSAEMNQNAGFKTLMSGRSDDPRAAVVQERQRAAVEQLIDTPVSPNALETLAAAVKTDANTPVVSPQTPMAALERGERQLAGAMHRVMLELKNDATTVTSKTVDAIPADSLFGQWRAYLDKALKARGFVEWARQQNVDLTTLRFDPKDQALIGKVNGVDQRFSASDFKHKFPQHFDVLTPVLTGAEAFAAHGKTISLSHTSASSAPFEWVANFYGISTNPASAEFARHTESMGRTQQFPAPPANPQALVNWLSRQSTAVGDSNDRYALIDQLKNANLDNDDATRFTVDPHSSHQPKGVTTVQKFLADQKWYGATSAAEKANLLKALQTPLPQSPALGNHWGFLSTNIPLNADQRTEVSEFVKNQKGTHDSLLSYLAAGVTHLSSDPEQALEQMLSTDQALEFATRLQTHMKGTTTATSLKQWLLTAMVLDLDPTAGSQHKTVMGADLMGADNSGRSVDDIRERMNHSLIADRAIPANLAPIVSRLMLAGAAPQLLVSDVPKTVTLGSPQFYTFTAAVNQIEWIAPGATANMTYQQVMDLHRLQPISALETQIRSYAQMNPLLDWAAINNGVDKDNYTLEQLKESQKALQARLQASAESISWLNKAEAPTRRAITLKVLREHFGADIDYESRYMVEGFAGGLISGRHYSIAEIYEAGRLDEPWIQEGDHLDFNLVRSKAKQLPNINERFDNEIKADFAQRRRHTVTLFSDMLSNMNEEERNSLIWGDVQFLNVEGAGSGMVMTSAYKGVRRDFAVYPALQRIQRIADIDPSTALGEKVSLEIDVEAFKNGTEPRPGVKSDVVLKITDQHLLDDNDEPWPLEVSLPAHDKNDQSSPNYERDRLSKLAKVMVDSTYLNKTEFINLHRNWSTNTLETAVEPSDFFKAIWHALPGTNSIEDLYHGEFAQAGLDLGIDVAIYAATEGAGKLFSLASSGARWAASKVSAGFIEKFGAEEAEHIALKDMTAASSAESLNAVRRLQGTDVARQAPNAVVQEADLADRTVLRPGAEGRIRATTVVKNGERYAYNPLTMEAEGPALEWVVPEGRDRIGRIQMGGAMETLRPLDGEIQTFVDTYDGKPRLNIMGHAAAPTSPNVGAKIVGYNDVEYSAAQVNQKLLERGVDIRDYANVRTLTCYSAAGGEHSYAAELSRLTGVPVKGFATTVTTEWTDKEMTAEYQRLLASRRKQYPAFSQADIEWLAENDLNKIFHNKLNLFDVNKEVGALVEVNFGTAQKPVYVTMPIEYQPVRFGPPKTKP